jgi:hypothetical protein
LQYLSLVLISIHYQIHYRKKGDHIHMKKVLRTLGPIHQSRREEDPESHAHLVSMTIMKEVKRHNAPGIPSHPSNPTDHVRGRHVYKTSAAAAASRTPALPATLAAALVNCDGADVEAELGVMGWPIVAVEVATAVVLL